MEDDFETVIAGAGLSEGTHPTFELIEDGACLTVALEGCPLTVFSPSQARIWGDALELLGAALAAWGERELRERSMSHVQGDATS